jgi:two-component system, cell cycle sensor histidine kinase and response regulator CckA
MEMDPILVVEDEKIVAMEIQDALRKMGYHVPTTAMSGEEAVRKTKELRPMLVLMDIKLKAGMDGIEAAIQIKKECPVPIVFMTAHADRETFLRSHIAEPYDYIIKPFQMKELNKRIEMALFRSRIEKHQKEREQWMADTLNGISEGIVTTDLRGIIQFINSTAETITGWTDGEALRRPIQEVFPLTDEETGLLKSVLGEKLLYNGMHIHQSNHVFLATRANGRVPVLYSVSPVRGHQGQVAGAVIAFSVRPANLN